MRAEFSAGLMAGPIAESLPPWRAMWKLTEVKEGAVIMSCLGAGDEVAPGDQAKFTLHTRWFDRTKTLVPQVVPLVRPNSSIL